MIISVVYTSYHIVFPCFHCDIFRAFSELRRAASMLGSGRAASYDVNHPKRLESWR